MNVVASGFSKVPQSLRMHNTLCGSQPVSTKRWSESTVLEAGRQKQPADSKMRDSTKHAEQLCWN
eukprot:9790788-Alexandrium_andersonii.AAC.1